MSRTGTNIVRFAVAALLGLAACLVAWWPQSAAGSGETAAVYFAGGRRADPEDADAEPRADRDGRADHRRAAAGAAARLADPQADEEADPQADAQRRPRCHNGGNNNSGGNNNGGISNKPAAGQPDARLHGLDQHALRPAPSAPSDPGRDQAHQEGRRRPRRPARRPPQPTTVAPSPTEAAVPPDDDRADGRRRRGHLRHLPDQLGAGGDQERPGLGRAGHPAGADLDAGAARWCAGPRQPPGRGAGPGPPRQAA